MRPQTTSAKIALAISVVAVVAFFIGIVNLMSVRKNLEDATNNLADINQQLENYEQFQSRLNYMADIFDGLHSAFENYPPSYRIDKGYVFLDTNGDFSSIIFRRNSEAKFFYDDLKESVTNADYSAKICNDINVEPGTFGKNNEATIKITSGSTKGYNIMKFSHANNEDISYVLIMVANRGLQ